MKLSIDNLISENGENYCEMHKILQENGIEEWQMRPLKENPSNKFGALRHSRAYRLFLMKSQDTLFCTKQLLHIYLLDGICLKSFHSLLRTKIMLSIMYVKLSFLAFVKIFLLIALIC